MTALIIFILCYALFVFLPSFKPWIALLGSLALIISGIFSPAEAFSEVHWNVMGLFLGTLLLADLFMLSRVPAVLAEWIVDHLKSVRAALLGLLIFASVISMFVENVAVVLVVGPIAIALCDKLKISPVNPMILLAMFSNLQGAATLIGDPPSMLLGSFLGMTFDDFFFYKGKLSLFFVLQVGALSTLLLAFWMFRKERQRVELLTVEKVKSWVPSLLLLSLILILALFSSFDPESTWLAGTTAIALSLIGIAWNALFLKWRNSLQLMRELDWKTTLFLLCLFILVAAIRVEGWMDALASWTVSSLPADLLAIYLFILILSICVSAFVDNVPFIMAIIPVVQKVADAFGFPLPLLAFAVLVGTCLGGNITPIGASANVVAVGMLEKRGYPITYRYYLPIGLLFTAFAVIPAAIFLWQIWS